MKMKMTLEKDYVKIPFTFVSAQRAVDFAEIVMTYCDEPLSIRIEKSEETEEENGREDL